MKYLFKKYTEVKYSTLIFLTVGLSICFPFVENFAKNTADPLVKASCKAFFIVAGIWGVLNAFTVLTKYKNGDSFLDE